MGYVSIKGGEQAIEGTHQIYDYLRSRQGESGSPLDTDTIKHQLRLLHSRVMSEGGIYHPELTSLAIKQSHGDTLEAAFALRAYRSTQARLFETPVLNTESMRLTRRISSAFKDIEGGQMLGASSDFHFRLMRMDLLDESPEQFCSVTKNWFEKINIDHIPDSFPKVLSILRKEGLLPALTDKKNNQLAFDITREPLLFPTSRSAALSTMTRSEQGSLLAIAYSNMRGYGDIHPTIAELRVGYLPVMLPHPITNELVEIGEVEITECEVVAMYEAQESSDTDHKPVFTLGYGVCFGHNEVKAISMAVLDRALQKGMKDGPANPSEDPEFVLLHIDGIDSMGFCTHYKMPHYVTFQSDMDRLRATQQKSNLQESTL